MLKVCVEPLPNPSKFNPNLPPGVDAWFHRACHRETAKRFQSVDELAEQLMKVVGLGAVQVTTHAEDRVQYKLNAATPEALEELANLPSGGMNAKTALLAGIVVGISLMVGLVAFLAWRESQIEEANGPPPAVSSAPAPSASAAPPASTTAAPPASTSAPVPSASAPPSPPPKKRK